MPAPPSRYRVVERERRLEVIDMWADGPRPAPPAATALPKRPALALPAILPRQTRFDGGAELTTLAFYDAHGPRTIQLDAARAATIARLRWAAIALGVITVAAVIAAPWILVAVPILLQKKVQASIRGAITRWLYTAAQGGA